MTVSDTPEQLFRSFSTARDFTEILDFFRQLCQCLHVDQTDFRNLYCNIKRKIPNVEARVLWNLIDKRAKHDVYQKNKACSGAKVLIIGAGPCGLRMAIEVALLGGRAVVIEMRDYFSRNNVLHLWPFVIHDLKAIGAKFFYPKFCTGSINHISIRCAQAILLKVALLLGVEIRTPVSFVDLSQPYEDSSGQVYGWRALLSPEVPSLQDVTFDIVVGADGKRNTLKGYERKCFRGKQALAITANFVNWRTRADNQVEEIGGLFEVFKPEFFDNLKVKANINLENFVYFRNDTHYFVMTAKRKSLLDKGVLREDIPEINRLLSPSNIDQERLRAFAKEVAAISTKNKIPLLEFALNHHGEDDVAIFDFTAMFQAKHSCRSVERKGKRVLTCIVGDSLIEPFWPSGSGCARGFLGVFDAAWLMRAWCDGQKAPLEAIAERESVFSMLSQTAPVNLKPKLDQYTIDPYTRYKDLRLQVVKPDQVRHLYDNDDTADRRSPPPTNIRRFTEIEIESGSHRHVSMDSKRMLRWFQDKLTLYTDRVNITDLLDCWRNGVAFCCLIHRYRPDMINLSDVTPDAAMRNIDSAYDVILMEWGVAPLLSSAELASGDKPDVLALLSYLTQVKEALVGEPDPAQRDPGSQETVRGGRRPSAVSLLTRSISTMDTRKRYIATLDTEPTSEEDQRLACSGKAARLIGAFEDSAKRRSKTASTKPTSEKPMLATIGDEAPAGLSHIEGFISAIKQGHKQTTLSEFSPRDDRAEGDNSKNTEENVEVKSCEGVERVESSRPDVMELCENSLTDREGIDRCPAPDGLEQSNSPTGDQRIKGQKWSPGMRCCICERIMYILERDSAYGYFFHRSCCRCHTCKRILRIDSLIIHPDGARFFCIKHAFDVGYFLPKRKTSMSDIKEESNTSRPDSDGAEGKEAWIASKEMELKEPKTVHVDKSQDKPAGKQHYLKETEGNVDDLKVHEDEWREKDLGGAHEELCYHVSEGSSDEDMGEAYGVFAEDGDVRPAAAEAGPSHVSETEPPAPSVNDGGRQRPTSVRGRGRGAPVIYRRSMSLRLLMAEEVQSGLEDVDIEQEKLERRARHVEDELRDRMEVSPPKSPENEAVYEEWLRVLHQKKNIRNKEFKLLLKKKLVELCDRRKSLRRARLESSDAKGELEQLDRDMVEAEKGLQELTSYVRELRRSLGDFGETAT